MVRRAGYIPRLSDQEAASRDLFAPIAAERLHLLAGTPYAELPLEELSKIAAQWYEACAYVLHFSSLVQMEDLLRQEVNRIGPDPELKTLRILLAALGDSDRQFGWTSETVTDMGTVVETVLADMGLVKKIVEEAPVAAAPLAEAKKAEEAPAAARPARASRSRIAMTAHIKAWEASVDIDEVVQAESVSREGFSFSSVQPYKRGMRLRVILPYTKRADEDKMNTMSGEVARVEPGADKPTVVVKFVRQ